MKNRKITEDEINRITKKCSLREKAFFTIIRQSGLLPIKIKQLRIENVERILEPDPTVPCKINVSHEKYPTFIGQEAIDHLKEYLNERARREKLTSESLLFTARNNPSKEIDTKSASRAFKDNAGKSSELELRSLIEFYKTNTKNYQDELKELGNDSTPKDDEFYRELYKQKAMPNLEIEPLTPMEMHQLETQNRELIQRLTKIENKILPQEPKELEEPPPEFWEQCEREIREIEEWLKKHPEEAKAREAQMEYPKELEEQDERFYKEYLEERVKELENWRSEIENTVKSQKAERKGASKHFPKRK